MDTRTDGGTPQGFYSMALRLRETKDADFIQKFANGYIQMHAKEFRAIQVWHFHDAPLPLMTLAFQGGDEDWLALIPPKYADLSIPWMEVGSFAVCDVTEFKLADGWLLRVGTHA